MDKYFKSIDNQIGFNKGKNLFIENDESILKFVDETVKTIDELKEINADSEKILVEYAVDKAIEEFYRINQYYTFNSGAKLELQSIYRKLFSSIKSNKFSVEKISENHYQNLKQWLRSTNPFAEKIYTNGDRDIVPVACSEYTPGLQLNFLGIDVETLTEPVLDIGCGRQANLVNYLCNHGIEAYGIDRFSFADDKLICEDWLEYDYGIENWGTVISNLGFSNHFQHHNLREDGNYIGYGKKYMEILKSLKINGRFHYAPDLSFIEQYLSPKQFRIEKNVITGCDFKASIITRQY